MSDKHKTEMVHIVDENDNVIDTVSRKEMRKNNLMRRVVRILLFNSDGKIFIHQRTFDKDYFPGYWDTSIAGVVTTVDYDIEALRELEEEVGISNKSIEFLYKFHNKNRKFFCKVYKIIYDGELNLQKEEIISGKFISIHEVKEMMQTKKFHPGGIETLNIYLGKKNIGQNKNETT